MLPQLGACEHVGRLLTGSGVDIEVTEEDLRIAGGRSAVLLVIVGLDVDGRGDRSLQAREGSRLAVSAADTVALGLGCQDHELQVGDRARDAVEREGHRRSGERDSCRSRSFDTRQGRRRGHDAAACSDHPEVQAGEKVRAGYLGFGAENGTALGRVGSSMPCQHLLVGQTLPSLAELLEHRLHGSLETGARGSAVSAVADVLATTSLCRGNALGATGHLIECDGGVVLHGERVFKGL